MAAHLPTTASELGHIFRNDEGHLDDTPENRALLLAVANDATAFLTTDRFGIDWYARVQAGGTQVWVQVRDGKIVNGGANESERQPNAREGLRQR